jgi:hypothetical protein
LSKMSMKSPAEGCLAMGVKKTAEHEPRRCLNVGRIIRYASWGRKF